MDKQDMSRRQALALLAAAVATPAGASLCAAASVPTASLTLWYEQPAKTAMGEGLPIGNGRIGAMVFGGTAQERLQFNEDSLWTGDENPTGDYGTMGSYQAFGDVHLSLPGHETATHYRRSLDLGEALAHVTYTVGGVTYRREYFASHPDQVLVVRLTADKPGAYTGALDLTDMHSGKITRRGRANHQQRRVAAMASSTRRNCAFFTTAARLQSGRRQVRLCELQQSDPAAGLRHKLCHGLLRKAGVAPTRMRACPGKFSRPPRSLTPR